MNNKNDEQSTSEFLINHLKKEASNRIQNRFSKERLLAVLKYSFRGSIFIFTLLWIMFGGLSEDIRKANIILIICIAICIYFIIDFIRGLFHK